MSNTIFDNTDFDTVQTAAAFIRTRLDGFTPRAALILGSGLGFFADERVENPVTINYGEIPGFPVSTAPGHKGRFVFGMVKGVPTMVMQGRFHFYEGWDLHQVTLPVRVMAALGVKTLVVTNAAGGCNPDYSAGDLMLISDHINFLGTHPLIGPNDERFGVRFPDMTVVYDAELRASARAIAKGMGLTLREGVYLATTGPSYETPTEVRAFTRLGADAVGMSTVPEAVVARHSGLKVVGISCITNKAAGLSATLLTAEEVFETAERVKVSFADLLAQLISGI